MRFILTQLPFMWSCLGIIVRDFGNGEIIALVQINKDKWVQQHLVNQFGCNDYMEIAE